MTLSQQTLRFLVRSKPRRQDTRYRYELFSFLRLSSPDIGIHRSNVHCIGMTMSVRFRPRSKFKEVNRPYLVLGREVL